MTFIGPPEDAVGAAEVAFLGDVQDQLLAALQAAIDLVAFERQDLAGAVGKEKAAVPLHVPDLVQGRPCRLPWPVARCRATISPSLSRPRSSMTSQTICETRMMRRVFTS